MSQNAQQPQEQQQQQQQKQPPPNIPEAPVEEGDAVAEASFEVPEDLRFHLRLRYAAIRALTRKRKTRQ